MKIRLGEVFRSFREPTLTNKLAGAFLALLILRLMAVIVIVIANGTWQVKPVPSSLYLLGQGAIGAAACLRIVTERQSLPGGLIAIVFSLVLLSGILEPTLSVEGGTSIARIVVTLLFAALVFVVLRRRALRLKAQDDREASEGPAQSSPA